MFLTRFYYNAKPWLPHRLRMAIRRVYARRIRKRCGEVWPILQSAGRQPKGWPGWPDGKQFAFVLVHDVESQRGLDRVRALAELEMSLGFRSAFYFIPEGPYSVPPSLRAWLVDEGFEVGVHDLHHDGQLFRDRETFLKKAKRINCYLKEWGAVGFRPGFMFHNLDWMHDLCIEYSASTFDTDPFEPQPDGVGTIFPFFVSRPESDARASTLNSQSCGTSRTGYVELPYTLPQDSTLFNLFGEENIDVWMRKLDWIVGKGGMALLNVHPDYAAFKPDLRSVPGEYPVALYGRFLAEIRSTQQGRFWHALPVAVARELKCASERSRRISASAADLDSRGIQNRYVPSGLPKDTCPEPRKALK